LRASEHAGEIPSERSEPRDLMLSAGTKLGPYEITLALGAGRMGEVYRARDSKQIIMCQVIPFIRTYHQTALKLGSGSMEPAGSALLDLVKIARPLEHRS